MGQTSFPPSAILTQGVPTTEPVTPGIWWLNNGVLTFSQGIPPTIDTQPANTTASPGSTATFTIAATNATSYQWQLDSGSGFANISGATSTNYTTSALVIGENGDEYRCVVTGPGGTVTSNAAVLTVEVPWGAEAAAYGTRVNDAGGTMTEDGYMLADAVFQNATTQGITLSRGYLFGTSCNLPSVEREVLELTGNGESLLADSVAKDSTLHVGKGSLCLEGYTAQEGKLKTTTESLFDNTDWTIFGYFQKPLLDTTASGKGSFFCSQYNTFAAGRFWMEAGTTGLFSFTPISNGSAVQIRSGANYSGGGIIEPIPFFIKYNATTRVVTAYNPLTGAETGTTTLTTDFTALPTHFGAMQIASAAAGSPQVISYFGCLKYSGNLTNVQMDSVWSDFHAAHSKLVDKAWVIGNSVTSGADAGEAGSNTANNWPTKVSAIAARNNTITIRPPSMGGKAIYFFRPSDYTQPIGSTHTGYPPYSAADSVDTWKHWKPTILVIDENQNTAASNSVNVDYEIDWGTLVDAIVDDLQAIEPGLKVVCGTQLAIQAKSIVSPYPDYSYAEMLADEVSNTSKFRRNLRDWSVLIRADSRYDAVAEIYSLFNQGFPTEIDGDAATPATDYPNGDPALFYDDPQHPNAAGHLLMRDAFWAAVNSVRLHA